MYTLRISVNFFFDTGFILIKFYSLKLYTISLLLFTKLVQ